MELISGNLSGSGQASSGVHLNAVGSGNSPSIGINELSFDKKRNNLVLFPNPSQNNNLISFLKA